MSNYGGLYRTPNYWVIVSGTPSTCPYTPFMFRQVPPIENKFFHPTHHSSRYFSLKMTASFTRFLFHIVNVGRLKKAGQCSKAVTENPKILLHRLKSPVNEASLQQQVGELWRAVGLRLKRRRRRERCLGARQRNGTISEDSSHGRRTLLNRLDSLTKRRDVDFLTLPS